MLIPRFGLIGVAVGAVAGSVVINLITLPLLVQRALDLRIGQWLLNACARPLAAAVLQLLLIEAIRSVGHPDTWVQLGIRGVLAAAGCALIVFAIGITAAERRRAFGYLPSRWRPLDTGSQATEAPIV
jgi:uncharacterized protein (DUF2062 family)